MVSSALAETELSPQEYESIISERQCSYCAKFESLSYTRAIYIAVWQGLGSRFWGRMEMKTALRQLSEGGASTEGEGLVREMGKVKERDLPLLSPRT